MAWRQTIPAARRRVVAVGLVAATAALVLPGATTAGAASDCPKGSFCVWDETNFQGEMVKLGKTGLSNKIYRKMNDQASSAKNRRGKASTIYADKDGGGDSLCLPPHSNDYSDLSGPLFDDIASSSRLHTVASCGMWRASDRSCPDGKLCVWSKAGFKGKRLKVGKVGEFDNKIHNKMNDKVSSVKNRWDHRADLFNDPDGGGEFRCFAPGQNVSDLSESLGFDNVASSAFLWPDPELCV